MENYARAALNAGVPKDQLENLVKCGIVLQPRQLVASAAARSCDHACKSCLELAALNVDLPSACPDCGPTEVGYGGARAGGKSHWLLAQLTDDCFRFDGLKCLMLRKVGKANRENFEDLLRKVLGGVKYDYKRQEGCMVFPNGSRILLGHFQNEGDIDAYLGIEYDAIGVEEATTLSFSKYRGIRTCCRTSKTGWRPRVYSTTNPGGIGHAWYKSRFIDPMRSGKKTSTTFVQATIDDNRFVNSEYRRTLDELTGWQRRAWLYGDWDIAAGAFFTTYRRSIHVQPKIQTLPSWQFWISLDYGFTHWTVCHLLAKDGDGNVFFIDEYAKRRALVAENAAGIIAMLERHELDPETLWKRVAGHDIWAKRGDSRGLTIADQYKDSGIVFEKADIDRINGAAEFIKRLGDAEAEPPILPTVFIAERCRMLAETLGRLEHDPHRPEDVLKVDADDDGIGGDDAYDCARYGLMAIRQAKRKIPMRFI